MIRFNDDALYDRFAKFLKEREQIKKHFDLLGIDISQEVYKQRLLDKGNRTLAIMSPKWKVKNCCQKI